MSKQNIVILSGILLVVILILISSITTCNIDNRKIEKIDKEIYKIDSIFLEKKKVIDSLTDVITFQDSIIALKKEDVKLIKPKYDKKIQAIAALPADSISLFLTNRYKTN